MDLIKNNPTLYNHLKNIFGVTFSDYIDCLYKPTPTSIRINLNKKVDLVFNGTPVPWCTEGLYLTERPAYIYDPLYHAGAYYPQEASSMFVDYVIKNIKNTTTIKTVLDLSAAPGGKTLILSDNFTDDTLIVANEVIQKRNLILQENITRWGCSNVVITNNDPAYFAKTNLLFDLILVDAPCSGEGMFRKDPDSIKQWSAEHVMHCSMRQKRILNDIINNLRVGGYLIYSTCTYNTTENEEIIEWLIKQHHLETIPLTIPDSFTITPSLSPAINAYRFYPHRTLGEGFFIALLQKNKATTHSNTTNKTIQQTHSYIKPLIKHSINKQLVLPPHSIVFEYKQSNYVCNENTINNLTKIVNTLKVTHLPNELGSFKGTDFVPAHALALNPSLKTFFPTCSLNEADALNFLMKNKINYKTDQKGYILVNYQGLGLGWIKKISDTRFNNYLPEWFRIKKQKPN
jgi:NOL1/NOP2/sun family putative RNA methylase